MAGVTGSAQAADPRTAKASEPPNAAPKCFGSVWDWLNTSISDCPLSYAGFTLYGTLDVGYGYDTAGVPFGNSYNSGVYYGISAGQPRWPLVLVAEPAERVDARLEDGGAAPRGLAADRRGRIRL